MAGIRYLDFDLQIQRVESHYRVEVDSPAGQASATFRLPFSDLELENFLLRVGRTRRATRRIDSPEVKAAKDFGQSLFDAVFTGELRGVLRSSIEESRRQGGGLRIRLRLTDVPELADLPWEYLYNPALNRFLGLSVSTPLVRYLDLPERIDPLLVSPPLKILVMISSPHDYPQLDVEREWTKLREALGDLEERGVVTLERLPQPSLAMLQRQLRRGDHHIFHFIGHGGFEPNAQEGVLVLEDENRRGRLVSGLDLGLMLHDEPAIRLAVLNACEGARTSRTDPFAGAAQSLVQQGLAAVIAMQFEITDEAAITFAHEFYGALADGYPVDGALVEARKAIFAQGNGLEWGTPVLYLRAPDGRIFDVERPVDRPPVRDIPMVETPVATTEAPRQPERRVVTPTAAASDVRPLTTQGRGAQDTRVSPWVAVAAVLLVALVVALVIAGLVRLPGRAPTVERFAAEPAVIVQGGTVTLSWRVRGAQSIEIIPPVGTTTLDPAAGQVALRPATRGAHTFTLRARRGSQAVERAATVTVRMRAPTIRTFTSSLERGGSRRIVLRWEVAAATSVRIDPQPGSVAASGSTIVDAPPQGQQVTYRLSAGNPDHDPVERVIAVTTVPRPPVVSSFEARPAEISLGQQSVLSWNVPEAETVSINGGIGSVSAPSGRLAVAPRINFRYVLTASNPHGSVTQTVSVRVRPGVAVPPSPSPRTAATPRLQASPRVTPRTVTTPRATSRTVSTERSVAADVREFTATPAAVNAGDAVRLCWSAGNARAARVDPDVGDIDPADVARGCRTVSPRQTTTYTLTVTGADGRPVSSQVTVEVRTPATSVELAAARTTLVLGDSTELCWVLFNARSARIDQGIGDLAPGELEKGCRTISPRQPTTYTITAVGVDGREHRKQITVEVRVLEVQILSFTVRKSPLFRGETTQVCWSIANARSASISASVGFDLGDLARTELERGCRDISPAQTTTYFLIVVGRDGRSVTQRLLVVVALR